jgi:calcineurin-like phosphoesterase family protein
MSSNIWFTSDHHFNHRNIIGYTDRPFPAGDTDAMNAALIDNWNSRIAPGDTVWVLGDFMGMPGGYADRLAAGFLAQLHGDKILVVGNHDTPSGKGPEAVRRHLAVGWTDIVATHTTMGIAGRDVTISHYPWRNGDPNQSKAHLRPVDVAGDTWLLHGHIHERWLQNGRMINAGVDAWAGAPVHIDEIAALIEAGPGDISARRWTEARALVAV